ncbi:MAG: ABC transporter substrate-binding protein, partial [Dehalococcoidales bacterium]|nr:ABC transporter substrate-binding protein [Dehalococcoidales bacterium]
GSDIVAYAAGSVFLIGYAANPGSVYADVRVRMAIDHAIDKEAVCKALGYGYMTPNHQIPAPQQPYHNPNIKPRAFDRNKAKELLAQAGYPNGFKTKLYVEGANYGTKALAIQAQLAAVGIQAEIVTLDNLKFWEYNMNGWTDGILFAGWSFSPNFAASYNAYFPPNGRFFVSLKTPDVSEIVTKALQATNPEEKRKWNYALVQALFDDCTVIPYLSDAMGWAVAPYVKDHHLLLEGADFNSWLPADIWLDK